MEKTLEDIIKQEIRDNGPMDLGRYMNLCLGHPEHGYYMTRDPFGVNGDFTTAPEISQMFGEMVGAWVADTWMKMGAPSSFILLECGPGRGTLMSDIMRATKNVAGFKEAVQIHLLEISPILRKKQKDTLNDYEVTWHRDLDTLPNDLPVIIIGNEFLDALATRQMKRDKTGWVEKTIDLNKNDTLQFSYIKTDKDLIEHISTPLIPYKIGDTAEVSLEQKDLLNELINIVIKQSSIAFFIDYGFIHNVAGDTLQAVKKHRYCDLLETPGEADITAHVNFAKISDQMMAKDLTVHGPVSQGDWLNALGISQRHGQLLDVASPEQAQKLRSDLQRLTGTNTKNNEMGALFKVIAFSSNPSINLSGF